MMANVCDTPRPIWVLPRIELISIDMHILPAQNLRWNMLCASA